MEKAYNCRNRTSPAERLQFRTAPGLTSFDGAVSNASALAGFRARSFTTAAALVVFRVRLSAKSVPASGQSGQSILVRPSGRGPQRGAEPGETVRRISIDEAVLLAMEQKPGHPDSALRPQIQGHRRVASRSSGQPQPSTTLTRQSQTQASTSSLSGGATQIDNGTFATGVGLAQTLPWGGNYTANWNSSRVTTTNLFSSFSPQLSSNLNVQYTQPLLRNFQMDPIRQQVQLSKKVARPVRHPARQASSRRRCATSGTRIGISPTRSTT